MYQGHQAGSTQVRERRYEAGAPEAPKPTFTATSDTQRRITLPSVPESAKAAREFTDAALRQWHLDALVPDAVLIASELITNAISHGSRQAAGEPGVHADPGGSVELTWSHQVSRLICVVTDRAVQPPVASPAIPGAESGYGLYIVGALAAAWGWTVLGSGKKAVWAALHLPERAP